MTAFAGFGDRRTYAGGKMLSARAEGVGLLTFNQPEKRNAISVEMWAGMAEILADFGSDPAIRCVVLTGAGDKAFVSGADISQFAEQRSDAERQKAYSEKTKVGREALRDFGKPTIAAIRGFCIGGGLAIAMGTDLRIASSDSQFGVPAARLGIAYGFEGLKLLVSLVGQARARMIMYSANRMDAVEAERIGLINQVIEPDQLENAVMVLARRLSENAPLAIKAAKTAIDEVLKDPADRDFAKLAAVGAACMTSSDYREGRTAFMEKRKPRFTGA